MLEGKPDGQSLVLEWITFSLWVSTSGLDSTLLALISSRWLTTTVESRPSLLCPKKASATKLCILTVFWTPSTDKTTFFFVSYYDVNKQWLV